MNTFASKSSLHNGKIYRFHLFEYTLYIIILVVALGIPFFTGVFTDFGWEGVRKDWVRLLPFMLIFAVNNYILVPKLLFREKYLFYILTCILSLIVVVCLSGFLLELNRPEFHPFEGMKRMAPPPDRRMPLEPPAFEGMKGIKPPPGKMSQPPFGKSVLPHRFSPVNRIPYFFNFGLATIAFLLMGFNAGIKSFVRWSEEKVRQAEKERQYFYTELAVLKHQISPHFFMNTLNNIHALVDINAKEAKNAIIKLSYLMRYLLYESDVQQVSLKKEIDFIENYIELMRLRYDEDNMTIETEYPDSAETIYVPSSLFLSFIENAFKHGVNPRSHSLIKFEFSVKTDWLTFRIINNRWDVTVYKTETTGIGLENVRKRLDLIYKDKYTLDINSSDNIYEVILKIPIS